MNEEGKIKTVLNDVFPMRNTDGTEAGLQKRVNLPNTRNAHSNPS